MIGPHTQATVAIGLVAVTAAGLVGAVGVMLARASRRSRIVTDCWRKPIPTAAFDWSATYDDYDLGSPVGHGATEAEAIADLVDNYPSEVRALRREASAAAAALAIGAFLFALAAVLP